MDEWPQKLHESVRKQRLREKRKAIENTSHDLKEVWDKIRPDNKEASVAEPTRRIVHC